VSIETTTTAPATGDTSTESTSVNVGTEQVATGTGTQDTATFTPKPIDTAVVPPQTPTYAPNFKYKAALEEKEIDPFWHGLIKDADSEKKVKELFTRADAFDYMKDKYTKRDTDYTSLREDYETQAKIVSKVTTAVKQQDYDTVFRNLGLNDHQVIQWAAKKVDYMQHMQQLPPEQRAAIERQQQAAFQNQEYQEQLTQMQEEVFAQKSQAREVQLDMTLLKPEISQSVQFWDSKMGYQGAFRDMVIEEAQRAWAIQKVDLLPEQAVARVMQRFGAFIGAQGAPSQAGATTQTMSEQGATPVLHQKPVIPVVNGAAKSPIKKQVRSVADIKQRLKDLESQDSQSL